MYKEKPAVQDRSEFKSNTCDKEPTELTMFIGRAYENNASIRNEINELRKQFSRFSDVANTLNPDKFYKNAPLKQEENKLSPCIRAKENSGLVEKLDNLLDAQKDIESSLAEINNEVREHALFFEKHI